LTHAVTSSPLAQKESRAHAYVSLRQVLWHELDERLHNDIETLEGLLQPFWTAEGVRASYNQPVLDEDDYGVRRLPASALRDQGPSPWCEGRAEGETAFAVP